MFKTILKRIFRFMLNIPGRAYVPGYELKDAMAIAQSLAVKNVSCTVGYFYNWLDPAKCETGPQIVTISQSIVNAVAGLNPKGYLSVKAPAFDYDPDILADIVESARTHGVLVHFDSHDHSTADATLNCVYQAVNLGASVGLTIPGRWRRSLSDADIACEHGVRVRVVKGENGDPGDSGIDLRQGYLQVIDRLAGRASEVAIASHDPWLVRESLLRLRAANTACEIELLNGMPKGRILALATEFSVPVRVYIPFGISWRPYALDKVANNPRMLFWVVRDSILGFMNL